MKLFLDSANIDEIKSINNMGVIKGITTNPTLMAKEGKVINEVLLEIANLVDGPISGEVNSLNHKEMINEGVEIAKIHKNMVVKIPMCNEGLKAVKELTKLNIKTNVTLIFTVEQAYLAALAGASFVSPFVGRLEDYNGEGIKLIEDIKEVLDLNNLETEIIAASIRNPKHVMDVQKAGAHIATVPYKVFEEMLSHPLTTKGIESFVDDYNRLMDRLAK